MAAQDLSINDLAALPVYEGSGIPAARFYDGSGQVQFFGNSPQTATRQPVQRRTPISGLRGILPFREEAQQQQPWNQVPFGDTVNVPFPQTGPQTGYPTINPDNPAMNAPLAAPPRPRQNASRNANVSNPGQRSGLANSLFSLFYGRRGIGSKTLGPGVGSLPSADAYAPPQNHIGPDGSPRPQFAPKQNLSAGLTYSSGRTYDLPTPGIQSPGINRSY